MIVLSLIFAPPAAPSEAPQTSTISPTPCYLHPDPQTLHPKPDTLDPRPSTLHPHSGAPQAKPLNRTSGVAERDVIKNLLDAQNTGVSMPARDLLPLFDVKRKCVEPFIILERGTPTLTLGGRQDTQWTRCSWSMIKGLARSERGVAGADSPVRLSPDVRLWRPVCRPKPCCCRS